MHHEFLVIVLSELMVQLEGMLFEFQRNALYLLEKEFILTREITSSMWIIFIILFKNMLTHTLPDLSFPYDALEPHIDALTMEIHHGRHHQAYITNYTKLLE